MQRFFFSFCFFFLFLNILVSACVSPPKLEFSKYSIPFENYQNLQQVKNQLSTLSFKLGFEKNIQLEDQCAREGKDFQVCLSLSENKFELSSQDIDQVSNFLNNGYAVFQQTDLQYKNLLKEVKEINSDNKNCKLYRAVAHFGLWTGYILDSKPSCQDVCQSIPYNIVWNDLERKTELPPSLVQNLVFVVFFIILVISGILFIKRSRKENEE